MIIALKGHVMTGAGMGRLALVLVGFTVLSACEDGKKFKLFDKPLFAGNQTSGDAGTVVDGATTTTIEKDVEAPEVFQKSDSGLWDGRPSLGGVWVAHPDVVEPERVIIRNEKSGKFIIGALFRRERENPGPRFQVSSDAAAELGMLAGAPVTLNVTALRKEIISVIPEVAAPAVDTLDEPQAIVAAPIEATGSAPTAGSQDVDSVASIAASAIEAAVAGANDSVAAAAATSPPPRVQKSSLEKAFIQIGIFAIESNANDTSSLLRNSGIVPTIKTSTSSGKKYWRVVVGPAANKSERSALIKKVRSLGFSDAYAVTN